jgi:chorismate mutase
MQLRKLLSNGITMVMSLTIDNVWNVRPFISAGPCSAETEEQVLATARAVAENNNVVAFRAGIWKPRTRPGSFEGIGAKGLPWLKKVKEETGLFTMTEVANARQAEDALQFEIDIIWIGARSTVNPASVQEIANALRGTQIPVLIKNPINPELELWSGAIERIASSGVQRIGLVHRGFSVFGNTDFRYAPMWHIPIEMRRRYPDLMMICDPNHICGRRNILRDVSQKAIDLDFDGLMIETHIDPDNAWTDKKQQVSPALLDELLQSIVWRNERTDAQTFNTALEALREQINQVDYELLELLSRRMKISEEIGKYKKNNKITILQTARWNEILQKEIARGAALGLSPDFIKQYLEAVHLESINHQNDVMNKQE